MSNNNNNNNNNSSSKIIQQNDLLIKYNNILDVVDIKKINKPEYASLLHYTINLINDKYSTYTQHDKIAGTYVFTKLYKLGTITNENKIKIILSDFYDYLINEFVDYKNSFVLITDIFDLNLSFYDRFIDKYLIS